MDTTLPMDRDQGKIHADNYKLARDMKGTCGSAW